jgi:type IV secretory pathway ATPase VirB11/archaellum biosynthesis ATPase
MTDGGIDTQYYWCGEEGVVYHTEADTEIVNPFFRTEEEAERFLERIADRNGKERYSNLVLRKTGNQKVMEATDVLTKQSGLAQF